MSGVQQRIVKPDEAELRLDRWFARHFPGLSQGRLQKLCRTGQVRLDGARVKPNARIEAGQTIRVPPLGDLGPAAPKPAVKQDDKSAREVRGWVIYQDDDFIVLNKPAGLATQGGSGQVRHLDGLLDLLAGDGERPRLVHRLDKETSGLLLLGRSASMAARLAEAFRSRETKKIYWALVHGVPQMHQGRIDAALAKRAVAGGERVMKADPHDEDAKRAVTLYSMMDRAARRLSWLALSPLTGRTHQLRVHCELMGHPIVGDIKYSGRKLSITHEAMPDGISTKLHLHARGLMLAHPRTGKAMTFWAPLPDHMKRGWDLLGFNSQDKSDPFDS